jgi:ferredoxin
VQRLKIPLQDMPTQPADQRRHNMQEVALGYSAEQAQAEAMRCIQCRNAPCIDGCPVRIDIPGFIKALADGDPRSAIARIKRKQPAACGLRPRLPAGVAVPGEVHRRPLAQERGPGGGHRPAGALCR